MPISHSWRLELLHPAIPESVPKYTDKPIPNAASRHSIEPSARCTLAQLQPTHPSTRLHNTDKPIQTPTRIAQTSHPERQALMSPYSPSKENHREWFQFHPDCVLVGVPFSAASGQPGRASTDGHRAVLAALVRQVRRRLHLRYPTQADACVRVGVGQVSSNTCAGLTCSSRDRTACRCGR